MLPRIMLCALCGCATLSMATAQESSTDNAKQDLPSFKRTELNPRAREALDQGLAFLKAKDYKKAINAFGSAVKMHPRSGQIRHLLGVAYYRGGQGGPAWLQFRKAVILNPNYEAAVHDFQSAWSMFQKKGVFVTGRTSEDVGKLIGEPDGKANRDGQEIWQYGYMRLQFMDAQLVGVVDPRGIDKTLRTNTHSMQVEFDDRPRWKLGYREMNRLHTLSEYVPHGESVLSWKEMLQVQRLHKLARQRSPTQLMHNLEEKLKATDPNVRFASLASSDNEAIFQWNTPGTEGRPPQYEIVRIVKGPRDLHRVAYTRRAATLPQGEAQKWLNLLRKAQLKAKDLQSSDAANE